jgi:hypothetical protein
LEEDNESIYHSTKVVKEATMAQASDDMWKHKQKQEKNKNRSCPFREQEKKKIDRVLFRSCPFREQEKKKIDRVLFASKRKKKKNRSKRIKRPTLVQKNQTTNRTQK